MLAASKLHMGLHLDSGWLSLPKLKTYAHHASNSSPGCLSTHRQSCAYNPGDKWESVHSHLRGGSKPNLEAIPMCTIHMSEQ